MLAFVKALHPTNAGLNLRFTFHLRNGLSMMTVLAGIQDLIETYDALRTLYLPPPAGPAQRLVQSGELVVEIHDTTADAASGLAAQTAEALASTPFQITSDLPIRVAVVRAEGEPRMLAFAVSHLVVDYDGAWWIKYHLRALAGWPIAEVRASAAVHQPMDERAWERSAAGQRTAERALEHHERTFRALPQTMLPRPVQSVPPPRFRYLQLDSPALAAAVPALAQRHKVSTTAVLYAGIAVVAGYVSRLPRALLQLTVGNRIEERTRCAVGMFTQDVPAYVDLADSSVADVIARAGAAVLQAVRFGRYPPARLTAARSRVELDRGIALDLSCWLNHRLLGTKGGQSTVPPTARFLAEQRRRTQWRWIGADETSTSTYFVHADHLDGEVRLTMLLDTAILPPEEGVSWLRSVEWVLSAAAVGDVAVAEAGKHTGLCPASYDDGWHLVDYCWVHVPAVADLVRRVAGTGHADVFPVAAPDGTRLVAYVAGPPAIDLQRLHADCVAALPGMRTVMAPHHYVACDRPAAAADLAMWRRLPAVADGSGRPPVDQQDRT